ncbi:MAG TPA: DUF6541 family protein [Ktedonobacteraceae bacterium]|nr:DUF6541 family protein [Ktedonobacteraceae bacterium]
MPAIGQLAALTVVACLLLWPAPVTQNQLFAAWLDSDLMLSHWPTALLIQRTFAQSHSLPLWNPYFGGGQPLGADPLAALFYPPTHLVHFFSLRDYYLVLILGHLVWAGVGMLLLARRALGLPRLPALVAAISYMATPALLGHLGAGHITIVQTVAWYPWLALACWATVRDPFRWGALLGLCIALTLLAGHPQMAYYGLLMTVILAAWLLAKRWRQDGWRALLASIGGLGLAGIIGVLLAAIHLLPLMEFTALSTRRAQVIIYDTYPIQNFLHALVYQPSPNGLRWEDTISPGLVVLVLAFVGLVTRLRTVWPLILAIVLVAALAIGYASPIYPFAVRFLPDLNRFRDIDRVWFVALILISLLTGFGADALMRGARRILNRGGKHISRFGQMAAGLFAVLLVAFSLVVSDFGYARVGDINAITTPTALANAATRLAGSGRVYGAQENIMQLYAAELQVPFADGLNPLMIESYVTYMLRADGLSGGGYYLHIPIPSPSARPDARLLGLMNVSVVVSRTRLSDPHFVQVGEADGTLIYRNTADAGPGYLVRPGPGGNAPTLTGVQRLNESVRVVTLAPGQETFTFTTNSVSYFVIASPSFPGWIANVDGHDATIQQFAGALPAIKVGPGTHTLSYTYAPSSVRTGAILSLVGLLAALLWLVFAWLRKAGQPGWPWKHESEITALQGKDNDKKYAQVS